MLSEHDYSELSFDQVALVETVRDTGMPYFVDSIPTLEPMSSWFDDGGDDSDEDEDDNGKASARILWAMGIPYSVDSIPLPTDPFEVALTRANDSRVLVQHGALEQWMDMAFLHKLLSRQLTVSDVSNDCSSTSGKSSLVSEPCLGNDAERQRFLDGSVGERLDMLGSMESVQLATLPTWPYRHEDTARVSAPPELFDTELHADVSSLLWVLMDAENLYEAAAAAFEVGFDTKTVARYMKLLRTADGQRRFVSALWHHTGKLQRLYNQTRDKQRLAQQRLQRLEQSMAWSSDDDDDEANDIWLLMAQREQMVTRIEARAGDMREQLEDLDTVNLWCVSWQGRLFPAQTRAGAEMLGQTVAAYLCVCQS